MKPKVAFQFLFLLSLLTAGAPAATTLFADNFNRADSTDLNASTDGKSGTLGALNWTERNNGGNATIDTNRLQLGDPSASGQFSTAYVNHNFTDATIATVGEFTVSVDVFQIGSSTGGTRNTGFSIGNSLTDVSTWASNSPTSFPSDFFMGYDSTGTKEVKIRLGGAGTYAFNTPIDLDAGGTLSARFFGFSNFNSTTTVNYEAFINGGTAVATGTFAWSGTNENYINLFSNFTSNSGRLDNFSVATIPEPSAALLGSLGLLALLRRRR